MVLAKETQVTDLLTTAESKSGWLLTFDPLTFVSDLIGRGWLLSCVSRQVNLHIGPVAMLVCTHFTFVHGMTWLFSASDMFTKALLRSWSETTQEAVLLYSWHHCGIMFLVSTAGGSCRRGYEYITTAGSAGRERLLSRAMTHFTWEVINVEQEIFASIIFAF